MEIRFCWKSWFSAAGREKKKPQEDKNPAGSVDCLCSYTSDYSSGQFERTDEPAHPRPTFLYSVLIGNCGDSSLNPPPFTLRGPPSGTCMGRRNQG